MNSSKPLCELSSPCLETLTTVVHDIEGDATDQVYSDDPDSCVQLEMMGVV